MTINTQHDLDEPRLAGTQLDSTAAAADRPPWLAMIVAYLAVDSGFRLLGFALAVSSFSNLIHSLPPLCFIGWYAWETPAALIASFLGFCRWFVPALCLGCACSMWRQPERTKRLTIIAGTALATVALCQLVAPLISVRRVWTAWYAPWAVAKISLPVFGIWFVQGARTLKRPEVTLLLGFLVIGGTGRMVLAIGRLCDGEGWSLVWAYRGYSSWSYAIVEVVDVLYALSCLLAVAGGLALARKKAPIRFAAAVFIVCNLLVGARWVVEFASDWYGPFLYQWRSHISEHIPTISGVVLGVLILRFAARNRHLFRTTEEPLCRSCDYNLTGNESGVCPECGTEVKA